MIRSFLLLLILSFTVYINAEEHDLEELNNSSEWLSKIDNGIEYYYKKDYKKIPVLCFHIIGDEPRYEITAEKFEQFLQYLNKNNFYVISDKELINRDFSKVPTGYKPIVLGSDDASEGNFLYKTDANGDLIKSNGEYKIQPNTMVSLLQKYITPRNGVIPFTFYVAFNGVPFRQTGGLEYGENYRGNEVIKSKFDYILDNFILGIHTVTHPVTKDTSVADFKLELDEFYSIMDSYVGGRVKDITTLAYPYGCGDLDPALETMIKEYRYKDVSITGAFDFDGYFSNSPFTGKVNNYEISRLGVDNYNIDKVYGFLESVPLYVNEQVIVEGK